MPDPNSKSPSFDFLNDLNTPKNDEPAPEGNEAMFDFGDFGASDEPAPAPMSETPPGPGDVPEPTGEAPKQADDDLAFFDDLMADEAPAEVPAEPVAESNLEMDAAAAGDEPLFPDIADDSPAPTAEAEAAPAAGDEFDFLSLDDVPAAESPESMPVAESPEVGEFAAAGPSETPEAEFDFGIGDAEAEPPIDESFAPETEDASMPMEAEASADEALFGEDDAGAMAAAAMGAAAMDAAVEEPPPEPVAEEEPLPPDPEIVDPEPTPAPLAEDHPHMQTYGKLCAHVRQASTLGAIESVLGWDERCMMPASGAETRAEQITLLSGMIHDRLVDPQIGDWLDELADSELAKNPHDDYGATIRQLRRQYEKRTKLPKSLVEELSHTAVMGQHVWQEARKNDDFATFAPLLTKMIDLKRQQAEALGYAETPYDALLDEFEPGELTSRVTAVLGALRDELVPLVGQIRDGGRSPDLSILERTYPIETQRNFGRAAAGAIGFDFERGRLDVTAHPFCTGLGPNDCRITTRYDENFFNAGFFGILHEAGHGIYDQGLRPDQYGLPVGEAVSMGIHESQSRLWEILVGRSLPFWRHMYPAARAAFPAALNDVTLGRFFFAVNDVRSSLIRVEADEYTYNLHILIRFELEQALIRGDLSVTDLPGAWREKYREYLGLEVPNDADGVLQDIHWSAGLFGYFPTYSLGNLYAAQFYEQADQELGGLERRFARGEFTLLRRWLQAKIHREGQRYTAAELCERVTGKPLSHAPLMRHLRAKYELLYAPEAASLDDLDVGEAPSSVGVMEVEGTGYGVAAEPSFGGFGEAAGDFGGTTTMPGTKAPTAWKPKKKEGGLLTTVILLGGIVGGGALGIAMGLWILLWWKGPAADFMKLREKLPSWMLPSMPVEEDLEPVEIVPPRKDGEQPSAARDHIHDVADAMTARMLAAARRLG